jgi:hypothetical protein
MKKVLLALCAVIMLIQMSGCEPSVRESVVSRLPDKLIYIVGSDTELDLEGGKVTFHMGYAFFFPDSTQENLSMDSEFIGIRHDIDFNTPGVYEVTINKGPPGKQATFEIQVVTQEEYDAMMAQEE